MPRGKRKLTAALKVSTQDEIVELGMWITMLRQKRKKLRHARVAVRRKIKFDHWNNRPPDKYVNLMRTCECRRCTAWRRLNELMKPVQVALRNLLARLDSRSIRMREIRKKERAGGLYVAGDCQGQVVMEFATEE